ncbi:MAG: aspartate aminotransferase family protein [Candidatus Bathyarchaeia archaeon]|nr:aspartate aminotransferase family protein [Candidatus Bathyarchaeota archaeon]
MVSWEDIIEWDRKYYLGIKQALSEWAPIPIAKVEDNYLITSDGNRILDFLSGLVSVNAGQRQPKIIESIKKALDNYGYVWEFMQTPYKSEAAKLIIEDLLGPDNWAGRVRFVNSGSEANEEAFILARLYTNKPYIIAREFAYHGWTTGAGSCCGLRWWRGSIASPTSDEYREVPNFQHGSFYVVAPAPHCYRCPFGYKGPKYCTVDGMRACLNALWHQILSLGPQNVAAIITEIISGGGLVVSPLEWVKELRDLTQKNGILWIDDEVMTGFGRTGKWFCYQHYGVTPDIMTMGKGIVSSQLPAAGVVVSKKLAEFFEKYRWWHANTYAAHPVVMAAVVANIKFMIEENLVERAAKMGEYLGKQLKELESQHKCVGEVSGMGLFWGVELVKNKETKEPFFLEDRFTKGTGDVNLWAVNIVQKKALEKGVLVGGFAPNCLRLGPALTVTEEEIDKAVRALDYAFSELDKYCV